MRSTRGSDRRGAGRAGSDDTVGGLSEALARGRRSLTDAPNTATLEARRVLAIAPESIEAKLLLGAALRRGDDLEGALAVLTPLAASGRGGWGASYELGAAFAALGRREAALAALGRAVALNPTSSLAAHALHGQQVLRGGAATAPVEDARLLDNAQRFFEGGGGDPGPLAALGLHVSDLMAVALIAEAGLRLGLASPVNRLIERHRRRAPGFLPLRLAHATALLRGRRIADALAEADAALDTDPAAVPFLALKAAALVQRGDEQGAEAAYGAALAINPSDARLWLAYGHVLKAAGRAAEGAAAYRRSLTLEPGLGEAYWSLANLKVDRFSDSDRMEMRARLAASDLGGDDRISLHFALGKALEDEGAFAEAFDHYAEGARRRRATIRYDADAHSAFIRRSMATFTHPVFAARAGGGRPDPDPIFVVGLPRSGSTLVEQILASHPDVEGLSELPHMPQVAAEAAAGRPYPEVIADLAPAALATLGEAYLDRSRQNRRLGRPRFVDKFPGNVLHIGLIHLILPNARIVDVRREPMACGFSLFKQLFADGQGYSYDLEELGRYYRDYVALTAHFDAVQPGRVHRVDYETLVAEPEREIRRLLAACGLAFEPGCLESHKTLRTVWTPSAEQVRRPLSREGLEHWRNFAPWLGPLKAALEG